jgi:hypothetical protein
MGLHKTLDELADFLSLNDILRRCPNLNTCNDLYLNRLRGGCEVFS